MEEMIRMILMLIGIGALGAIPAELILRLDLRSCRRKSLWSHKKLRAKPGLVDAQRLRGVASGK